MPFPNFQQLSPAEDERIAELYEMGFSQPEVARAVGRSRQAVRQALRRTGVPVRTSKQGQHEWLKRKNFISGRRMPPNSVFALGAQ